MCCHHQDLIGTEIDMLAIEMVGIMCQTFFLLESQNNLAREEILAGRIIRFLDFDFDWAWPPKSLEVPQLATFHICKLTSRL